MIEVILATRNPSKAEQIREIFNGSRISIVSLNDAGIVGDAVEDGTTLKENALKKARFAYDNSKSKTWVMADDTGIFINALYGKPGISASRWAGETATTEEITQYTLKRLEGATDRSATFETLVALISPECEKYFFSGKCIGKLLDKPRTNSQPKMPYSPLFVPDGMDLCWAEMTVEQENKVSHRGKAFSQARTFLESQYKH